jgi:hypothetical protein
LIYAYADFSRTTLLKRWNCEWQKKRKWS